MTAIGVTFALLVNACKKSSLSKRNLEKNARCGRGLSRFPSGWSRGRRDAGAAERDAARRPFPPPGQGRLGVRVAPAGRGRAPSPQPEDAAGRRRRRPPVQLDACPRSRGRGSRHSQCRRASEWQRGRRVIRPADGAPQDSRGQHLRHRRSRAAEGPSQRAAHRRRRPLRAARAAAIPKTLNHRQRVSSGNPFENSFGYCRAIRIGDRVMVSGTAPVWPDGSVQSDAYVQAKRCFEIIGKALAEAGASLDQVVRTRMYVTGLAWVDAVGKAHGEAMANARPVATMVVVKDLIDERWKVEIEAEAVIA